MSFSVLPSLMHVSMLLLTYLIKLKGGHRVVNVNLRGICGLKKIKNLLHRGLGVYEAVYMCCVYISWKI